MMYFKFKLQLKVKKKYSYNCKFSQKLTLKKIINLQLKFRANKNNHDKRGAHWYIVTSKLLKPL
jgi:hypothetical protein